MSKKLFIDEQWQELFFKNNLRSYEDFLQKKDDFEVVSKETNSSVHKFQLPQNPTVFFLKVKYAERPRKILRSFLKSKIYKAPIETEIENLKYLRLKKIPVMDTAGWGINKTLGYTHSSFLIAPKVPGTPFVDFYKKSDFRTRKELYKQYAKLLASLHIQGINSPMRAQDILCNSNDSKVELTLIDREIGSPKKKVYKKEQIIKEIITIIYQSVKIAKCAIFSKIEATIFCKEYLRHNSLKIDFKEFFIELETSLNRYISKRKSSSRVHGVLARP